jgi:hypothetical protein
MNDESKKEIVVHQPDNAEEIVILTNQSRDI